MTSRRLGTMTPALLTLGVLLGGTATESPTASSLIAKWTLDDGAAVSGVPGIPDGRVVRAARATGHAGGALGFEDWSTRNYLKPDAAEATRVVIPHDPKLNPSLPFRLTAWIHPTADPVYMGGIVEKGQGYGASYRLLLLRGLKLEGCVGEQHVCVRSASPLALNGWHEVTLRADAKTVTLLVDGAAAGTATIETPLKLGSTEAVVIGDRFTGRIDEISISAD